ncbi:hypothetical protein WHR41_02595 [Cladosporium halotolerans]|uniref:Enoyl reductase (ER) domain-containing protein n=1 Tax=Cladosporium halotolerans TaxID=1052096 RepID=A0AB34KWV1_9PEZI
MRAARYYGKEDVRIENDVPPPPQQLGEGMVRIKPAFVGICGTDLHEYFAGPNFSPKTPHPITKETLPITIGHEFSGIILSLGPKPPRHLRPGMKIAIRPSIYCGACPACKLGAENACPSGGFVGLSGGGGGMSDELILPAEACHPLPSSIGLDIGALVEPLAVAWHAVNASPIADYAPGPDAGAKCLVLGGGPIGLAVCQVLQARGAAKVIMSEISAKRQHFARQLGASNVLDPRQFDMVASARQLTGGAGPDIVFDCAGVAASLETACRAVRVRGWVVNVAIWEERVPFDPNWLVFREARYSAVLGYQREDFDGVIEALADGRIKPEKMITARIGLEDLVEQGYGALKGEREKHVKVLIDMSIGA